MGTKPTECAKKDDEWTQLEILHVDKHGSGNPIDGTDHHHLEENLQKKTIN
jgi:hypothetical protein